MLKATQVKSPFLRAMLPEAFKELQYVQLENGEKKTITDITYSTYVARDKEGNEIVANSTGQPLLNTTAYMAFSDGTYSTAKNDIVLGQLFSETGEIENKVGVVSFHLKKPVEVQAEYINMKIGKKNAKEFKGLTFKV